MSLIKHAYLGPISAATVGALRASNLTKKDKEELSDRYGIDPEANFAVRNAGRGIAGGSLGAGFGSGLGAVAGALIALKTRKKAPKSGIFKRIYDHFKFRRHPELKDKENRADIERLIKFVGRGALGAGLTGGAIGTHVATNKYSRSNVRDKED